MSGFNNHQCPGERPKKRVKGCPRPVSTSSSDHLAAPATLGGAQSLMAGDGNRHDSYECEQCGESFDHASELKAHNKKSHKAFFCSEPICWNRGAHGTINDLQRHTISSHAIDLGIGKGKFYSCAADECTPKGRNLKRADNFKTHVSATHVDLDEASLVELYRKSAVDRATLVEVDKDVFMARDPRNSKSSASTSSAETMTSSAEGDGAHHQAPEEPPAPYENHSENFSQMTGGTTTNAPLLDMTEELDAVIGNNPQQSQTQFQMPVVSQTYYTGYMPTGGSVQPQLANVLGPLFTANPGSASFGPPMSANFNFESSSSQMTFVHQGNTTTFGQQVNPAAAYPFFNTASYAVPQYMQNNLVLSPGTVGTASSATTDSFAPQPYPVHSSAPCAPQNYPPPPPPPTQQSGVNQLAGTCCHCFCSAYFNNMPYEAVLCQVPCLFSDMGCHCGLL